MKMKINRIRHWAKAFIVPWIYTALFIVASNVAIAVVWTIFGLDFQHERTLCSVSDPQAVERVLDRFLTEYPDTPLELEPAENERCSGYSAVLKFSYRGNHFRYMARQGTLDELAKAEGLSHSTYRLSYQTDRTTAPLGAILLVMVVAAYFLVRQRRQAVHVSQPDVRGAWPGLLGLGLLTGIVTLALVSSVFFIVQSHIQLPRWGVWEPDRFRLTVAAVVVIVVLAPIFEEIVFRAWLLEAWRKVITPAGALLLSAAAFSAAHPMGLVLNALLVIPGLVFGLLWLRTRSLLACCVAHGGYNAVVLVVLTRMA